jgi:hypothetical protein
MNKIDTIWVQRFPDAIGIPGLKILNHHVLEVGLFIPIYWDLMDAGAIAVPRGGAIDRQPGYPCC